MVIKPNRIIVVNNMTPQISHSYSPYYEQMREISIKRTAHRWLATSRLLFKAPSSSMLYRPRGSAHTTGTTPCRIILMDRAAATDRSSPRRALLYGPRSRMVTITLLWLFKFVTLIFVPRGNVLCAANSPFRGYICPSARVWA